MWRCRASPTHWPMNLPTVATRACLHPARRRRATSSLSEHPYSLSQNFDDHPFLPLPVPLSIKHPLPRPKVQLPRSDRHDHLVSDRETAQMRRRVVLTRFIVAIPRRIPRGDRAFQPLQNVVPQSRFVIVDEHGRGYVHGAHQDQTFTHRAGLHLLHNLVGNVDDLLSPLRVEPEVVRPRLHESPVSNCHRQTESLNWPEIWPPRFPSDGGSSSSSS